MKTIFIQFRIQLILFLFCLLSLTVYAQKPPKTQTDGLHAPANIKIDGKVTEWDQKKLAYNNATEVFYELANDDNNLYLLISARKREVIEKILLGGATLTIDLSDKKDDKGVAITFPTYYKNERSAINLKNTPKINKDSLQYRIQVDSFRRAINQDLSNKSKLIEIERIKSIPDSLISAYNDYGIKATALFDKQLSYNSELAIPIKYLNLNNSQGFIYQIKLNGASANNARIQPAGKNGQWFLVTGSNGSYLISSSSQYSSYVYPTYFWGKYQLAK